MLFGSQSQELITITRIARVKRIGKILAQHIAKRVKIELHIVVSLTIRSIKATIIKFNGKFRFHELPRKSIGEEIYDGF
jgi:hypothetical protein